MTDTYERYIEERAQWMRAPLRNRLLHPVGARALATDDYAYGVDVSHWQGVIDWKKLAQLAQFAYIKATDSTWTDAYFAANMAGAQLARVPRGIYHFIRPSPSGTEQAKYCIEIAKSKAGGLGELPLAVDVEVNLPVMVLYNFCCTVQGQLGYWPLVYCSRRTWQELLYGTKTDKAWAAACPLWVASWDTWQPVLPYTWTDWAVHQYSSKGSGALYGASSRYIDLNRAKRSWLSKYVPSAPPGPTVDQRIVTAKALNMRSQPDQGSADLGTLAMGSDVQIVEKQGDWGKMPEAWVYLPYTKAK